MLGGLYMIAENSCTATGGPTSDSFLNSILKNQELVVSVCQILSELHIVE